VEWRAWRGPSLRGWLARRLTALAVLTTLTAIRLPAQSAWSLADRAVVGSFRYITAVAAAPDRIYLTSPTALLTWNPQLRSWDGPFVPPDPRMLDQVFCGLVDPLDNSLWLGRADGWVHFMPQGARWGAGMTPAVVLDIAFDFNAPAKGLYLRTPDGWGVIARKGLTWKASDPPARPLGPLFVDQALRALPQLGAGGTTGSDGAPPGWRYTAAAQAFGGHGWYLGTQGRGLLYLAEGAAQPEELRFGLPEDEVGGVVEAPGGVWVNTPASYPGEPEFSYVSSDLTEFRWLSPRVNGVPSLGSVYGVATRGPELWAATEQGLLRWDPNQGGAQLYGSLLGLPNSRVMAVAAGDRVVAVGTAGGMARVVGTQLELLTPGSKDSVTAVELAGDTIWVGTDHGLFVALPIEPYLLQPRGLEALPFQGIVRALAWNGASLVAMSDDHLFWRRPNSRSWAVGPSLSSRLGSLRAFVPYGDGFFIAGDKGFGFARADSVPRRVYPAPADVPGQVRQMAVTDDYLWMATSQGLVRWRLSLVAP